VKQSSLLPNAMLALWCHCIGDSIQYRRRFVVTHTRLGASILGEIKRNCFISIVAIGELFNADGSMDCNCCCLYSIVYHEVVLLAECPLFFSSKMEKLGTKSQFLLCALYQKKSTVLNRRQRLPPKGNEKKWQDDATVAENSKKKIIMETSQSKASFFLFCFFGKAAQLCAHTLWG
jgi:hypothetical protein